MNHFEYLANVGVEQLFHAIHTEHAQTVAIILASIDKDVAADVLNMFSNEQKADITIRISQLDSLPDMLVKNISNTLKDKVSSVERVKLGGIKAVADILKHLDK